MVATQQQIIPANPRHSSSKENWGTPPWILEAARSVLGPIDVDPASSHAANKIVRAAYIWTKESDGLVNSWQGQWGDNRPRSIWLNPPGGKTEKTEGKKGGQSKVKLWWQKTLVERLNPLFGHQLFLSFSIEACQVTQLECERSLLDFPTCFFKRRVDYLDPITGLPVTGNTHSSCITYVPGSLNETHRFWEVFENFGKVTLGYADRIEA